MLKVAVIGGGPSGSCAAEILAKSGIKTWLFERKLDNAKPCGGAIPLCMVEEFDLPESIIDRKVRHMKKNNTVFKNYIFFAYKSAFLKIIVNIEICFPNSTHIYWNKTKI